MNSLPTRVHGTQVTMSVTAAPTITGQRWRSTQAITGP